MGEDEFMGVRFISLRMKKGLAWKLIVIILISIVVMAVALGWITGTYQELWIRVRSWNFLEYFKP